MSDALITRLEEAKEGSRELDCRIIAELTNPKLMTNGGNHLGRGVKWTPLSDIIAMGFEDWNGLALSSGVPAYTTSVDAALTLIPREWNAKFEKFKDSDLGQVHMSRTDPYDLTGNAGSYTSSWAPGQFKARPLPLAICIAALRARNAQ